MKNTIWAIALVCASVALAQMPGPGPITIPTPIFSPELREFLGLTSAQVESITKLKAAYNLTVVRKQMRASQVQMEIAEWTEKDPIVPMELGLRYAELEQIRRELRDEFEKTRMQIREVLTAAQRTKLQVLEDAAKLQPLVQQAQCENLIDSPSTIYGVIRAPLGTGVTVGPIGYCAGPYPMGLVTQP